MTVVIFLIVLAILIFIHELGHFLFALMAGIRVDEFALGFGPKIFSFKKGETVYALNLIPFGGYVKIFGENPDQESIVGKDSDRSFVHASKIQQVLVLFAGVLFNFIFAWIVISISFNLGVLSSYESYPKYTSLMTNPSITITYISENSPAQKSGLKPGDSILGYKNIDDVQNFINKSEGKEISIKVNRNNEEKIINIIPEKGIVEGKYAIGIAMDNTAILKLPFIASVLEGGKLTLSMMSKTVIGFFDLIKGFFVGKSSLSSVTGPVGIASMVGDAAKLGFTYLLMFTAIISINLGIINLVPFPALDGGRILFVIIEAIIRRPIKPSIANTINTIGFGLLMLLIVIVTYKDIAKLVH